MRASPLQVALLEQELAGLRIIARIRQLPTQSVRQAIVDVEQETDVERIANLFARDSLIERRAHICSGNSIVMKREDLEQYQHRAQFLVDRCRAIVLDDELRLAVTKSRLRDRGVSVSSKDALIEPRDECGKDLALSNAP